MTQRRSILDRQELYWPAPRISGQASYGGLLKASLNLILMSGGVFIGLTLLIHLFIVFAIDDGVTRYWIWFFPLISTFLMALWVVNGTTKRRDILVVLKESRRLEKEERNE